MIKVVGAVFVRDQTVFSAQRPDGKALGGYWEFPGGKIEEGEAPEEALARELVEELECEAIVGDKIVSTEYEYEFGTVELTTFYCTLKEKEPTLLEHQDAKWIPVESLQDLEWAPADIPAVDMIRRDLISD